MRESPCEAVALASMSRPAVSSADVSRLTMVRMEGPTETWRRLSDVAVAGAVAIGAVTLFRIRSLTAWFWRQSRAIDDVIVRSSENRS
jgi:hypothetical protein